MSQPPITPEPPSIPASPIAPPPEPSARRKRWPFVVIAVVATVVIVVGALAIIGSGSSSSGSYNANGVSFSYPTDWQDLGTPTYQAQSGTTIWGQGFGPKAGNDLVSVTAYTVTAPVAAASADQQLALLDRTFGGLITSQGGTVTSAMHATTLGGEQAFSISFTLPGTDGNDLITDDTIRIDGTTEYLVSCQSHAATQAQIATGCQQVQGTFAIS